MILDLILIAVIAYLVWSRRTANRARDHYATELANERIRSSRRHTSLLTQLDRANDDFSNVMSAWRDTEAENAELRARNAEVEARELPQISEIRARSAA